MDEFGEATKKFSQWLKDTGGYTISPKIGIEDRRAVNEGRSVVATDDIEKKELIFEVPRTSILNVMTSKVCEKYPEIKAILVNELGHWEGLIVCLLYEMKVLREKSRWWEYFLVLPDPESLQTLIFWPDEELEKLRPSLIVDRVGKKDAKEMYDRISEFLKEFGEPFASEIGPIDWKEFLYVASIIMSYSFDVENADSADNTLIEENQSSNIKNDSYMKSMIPLGDTLNSDTHKCNANLTYDSETLKMVATDAIKEGSQVYNIYGDHPNAELLRRYGYVEWEGSKYDFGELPLSMILQIIQEHFNVDAALIDSLLAIMKEKTPFFELFQGEEIIVDSYDCYKDGQLPLEGVLLIQILCLFLQKPNASTVQGFEKEKQLFMISKKSFELIDVNRVTKKCVKLWSMCIEKRLSDYPIHAFREACPSHDSFCDVESLRQTMVDRVLQSEVESLQSCLFGLDLNFKSLDDSSALENIQKRKMVQKKQKLAKKVKVKH